MGTRHIVHVVAAILIAAGVVLPEFNGVRKGASATSGLLRVHSSNPRYFTDSTGKAVYLAGHQSFYDLQDKLDDQMDWKWYLQFLSSRHLNYVRNWTEFSLGPSPAGSLPLPYERVPGYGNAADGRPKVDLYRFNQVFFDRMRSRAIDLGKRGIYISFMLFDVYGLSNFGGEYGGSLFNSRNNINGIDADRNGDGWGVEFFTDPTPELKIIQQNYVRKVIDTIDGLGNVFLEVSNEASGVTWHYEMIKFIKDYEAHKLNKHLIYLSPGGLNGPHSYDSSLGYRELVQSPADVFSVSYYWDTSTYRTNPPIDYSGKPAIYDMDHIFGNKAGNNDRTLPWKAFTRGYHFNLYDNPFENPSEEGPEWENVRSNIGAIANYANKRFKDLAAMEPSSSISSTEFALANPGAEYLIYSPNGEVVTVSMPSGNYSYEWFDPSRAAVVVPGCVTTSGTSHSFVPPFAGDAVLYLTRGGNEAGYGISLPLAFFSIGRSSAPRRY